MPYWKSIISASYATLPKDIQGNRTWPKPTNLNGSVPRSEKLSFKKWRLSLPHSNHGRPLGDSEDNLCHISIVSVVDDSGFRIPNLQTDASRGWNPVRIIWKNQLEHSWFVGGFSAWRGCYFCVFVEGNPFLLHFSFWMTELLYDRMMGRIGWI